LVAFVLVAKQLCARVFSRIKRVSQLTGKLGLVRKMIMAEEPGCRKV
jgi:hypothetical protein